MLVDPNLDPNIDPLQVLRRPTQPALGPGMLAPGREIPVSGALAAKLLGTGDSAPSEATRPSVRWPNALVPLRPPVLTPGREIQMASDADGSHAPLRSPASGSLSPAPGPINLATPPPAPMDVSGAMPRNESGLVRRGDFVAAGGNLNAPAAGARGTGLPALVPAGLTVSPVAAAGTTPAPVAAGTIPITPAIGPGQPSLRPATLTPPDPTDPQYQLHGAKRVGLGILGALEGLGGQLDAARSLNPYQRAMTAYNRNVEAEKTRLGLEDTQSQIDERRAQAARAQAAAGKPESLDQELAVTTMDAIRTGADPTQDPKVKSLIAVRNEAADKTGGPKLKDVKVDDQGNAIGVMEDGTTKPLGYKAGDQRQTHTSPFEAFAYGTADERKAAQDFLDLEKRVSRRYEKPGEVEERYALYQKDPEAYRAMYGERGTAQDEARTAKEQANATRMLNYFGKQRQLIENVWTLDETQKAAKLAEIEQLSQPYLNAAQPGGANGTGGAEDRVTVRDSKGNMGTVPRSKLGHALKKGYALAQ